MIAVVLFHVLIWDHATVTGGTSPLAEYWALADVALERMRMPVLFGLSGLLAAKGLSRGGRRGTARLRFAANFYLYAVWLTVYFAVFTLLRQEDFPHSVNSPGAWAAQFGIPETTLWFIFALALYPLVIVGLRTVGLSAVAVLVLGFGLWAIGNWADLPGFTGKIIENFVFFALGVHASAHLWRLAGAGWRSAAGFTGAFLTLVALATVVPQSWVVPVVLLSSVVAIPFSITAIALCCRVPAVGRIGMFIGSRTLPIYLLHPLLLAVWASTAGDWAASVTSTPLGDALYPPLLTGAVVLLSLLLHELLARVPGNSLFRLPPAIEASLRPRVIPATPSRATADGAAAPGSTIPARPPAPEA